MVGDVYIVNQMMVRLALVENGWAWMQYIDPDGVIRVSSAPVSALIPLRNFLMPKTAWPKSGNLDEVELEREQQAIAAEKKAKRKAVRSSSRKARRSMKIKRGVSV